MHKVNIKDLRRLLERADILLQREFRALGSHWNGEKQGFHTNCDTRQAGKINVTTTCFGLFALLRSPGLLDRFFAKPDRKAEATVLDGAAKALASMPWVSENLGEFNIYTTPIVVQTLYQLLDDHVHGPSVNKVLSEKSCNKRIREGLKTIIEEVKKHGAARFPPVRVECLSDVLVF